MNWLGAHIMTPAATAGSALRPSDDDGFGAMAVNALDLVNSYSVIFLIAFVVTLLSTPVIRRVALWGGVVDRPDSIRKLHRLPVAYMGGVAVFIGIIAAVAASYVYVDGITAQFDPVPIAIVIGMVAIAFTGLADDLWGWDPRLKIMGQLIAAAALAVSKIGVNVAAGVLWPVADFFGLESLVFTIPVLELPFDLVYWTGTALIAIFILGGCNAANLIDGLDGLLSGVVGIVALGLLVISVFMALQAWPLIDGREPVLAGARLVLAFALFGAVLGFLPHNFNPATIFLGDCGSLLLGYLCVVIILMFGEYGQTHLVFAGLIVFALPIMDTVLAIIRRKLSGQPMSAADDQHIHHQLRSAFGGGVKKAVFALYGISGLFALVGVLLAALVMFTELRVRAIYAVALVLFGFIGVIAVKAARRRHEVEQLEHETAAAETAPPAPQPQGAGEGPPTAAPSLASSAAATRTGESGVASLPAEGASRPTA